MNWRCFFGFHPWRRWALPFVVGVRSVLMDSPGEILMQQRECAGCGKIQQRRV